jgi:D-alanine-D-alanine ligase
MYIGLTYDLQTDPADPRQAEFDPPRTIEVLTSSLMRLEHRVIHLGNAEQLLSLRSRLADVDLVMNLAEGSAGRCREAWVPMLLEQWGVPFVGSGPTAQALGLDKVMSKRIAEGSGVPTPSWAVVERSQQLEQVVVPPYPLIVKPRSEGSGMGIDAGAVVHDAQALARRVEVVVERFRQPCLIEAFVPFGEVTVLLIGNDPPTAYPAIQRPLDPSSRLSCHVAGGGERTAWLCPVDLTPALDAAVRHLAVMIFEALRCRDVARVDFRIDEHGQPWFLEINPLPSFDPEGSIGLLAEYLGLAYTDMIGRVLDAACKRLPVLR